MYATCCWLFWVGAELRWALEATEGTGLGCGPENALSTGITHGRACETACSGTQEFGLGQGRAACYRTDDNNPVNTPCILLSTQRTRASEKQWNESKNQVCGASESRTAHPTCRLQLSDLLGATSSGPGHLRSQGSVVWFTGC